MSIEIITLNETNIDHYGIGCIQNKKHPGAQAKIKWATGLFKDGLKIKLLLKDGKTLGFIEYIPGLYTWRPISAIGFYVIHCIWIYKTENQHKGYASRLIQECIQDMHDTHRKGIAVVASEGSWLASPAVFEKNGFYKIDSRGRYDLLAYFYKETAMPRFLPWQESKILNHNFTLSYSNQCPANMKSILEIKEYCQTENIGLRLIEFKNHTEAQKAPTCYATFSLTHNHKVLADHYISLTRFKNIINQEKLA